MSPSNRLKTSLAGVALAASAAAAPLSAGDYGKAIVNDKAPVAAWSFCDLWDHTTLYKGDGFVKSVKFTGRYHGGYIDSSSDLGGVNTSGDVWEHRRWRAGIVAKLAGNLTFQNIYNLDTTPHFNGHNFVAGLDELFLKWEPSKEFYVIVGKHKPSILRDFAGSSNRLQVFERSFITQNTVNQKLWGAAVGFEALGLSHEIGVWSTHFQDEFQWPTFEDSGATVVYRTNYGLNENTKLFFDYEYTDQHRRLGIPANSQLFGAPAYEHIFALGSESKWGDFGIITDAVFAFDRGVTSGGANPFLPGEDTFGFYITPYYNLTEKLQLVGRYAYATDGRENRPHRFAAGPLGGNRPNLEDHHALYLGIQYFICGDKLKLQLGHEWASASEHVTGADYDSSTWLAGVRLSW